MINNIDLLSSLRVSTPDKNSKTVGFTGSTAEKSNIFGDSLKAAVRSRSQSETKADEKTDVSKALRKELVRKSEAKLRSFKKLETQDSGNVNQLEENADKQTDLEEITIEEILSELEELAELQQLGDKTKDKQTILLENIKEALNDLVSVQTGSMEGSEFQILQTKLAELAVVLESMQEELKTCGSLTVKEAFENSFKELKATVAEISAKVETASNKQAECNGSEQLNRQSDSIANELTASSKKAEDKSYKELSMKNPDENDNITAESPMINEALGKQKHDMKAEVQNTDEKSAAKEVQYAAEESTDDIKTALDSKIEKINVSGKENKKKGTEAGIETNKQDQKEAYKASGTIQSKPANEEMTAIKLEQTVIDNKLEAVQNQAAPSKVQTVNKADVINQIVKKAEIIFADGQPEMRMQLEPENLGKLTLRIAVEKGLITAKFVAESNEVKQIIESNFNELKDMLQEKGLEVQNFSVSVGHGDNREYNNNNAFQQWKETVKLNGRSMMRGGYKGYLIDRETAITINPYIVHNGEFDHRA